MKLIKQNIRLITILVCVLLFSLIVYGAYSITNFGSRWFSSSANNYLRKAKANVVAGSIFDRNNVALAATGAEGKRYYHPDETIRRAMVHVVGDDRNNIAYGAESFMANYLYAINESYLDRLVQAFQGRQRRGNDIRVSVDSRLAKKAYEVFPKGKSGAVIVMNYRTGELLNLQSYPSFDPMALTQVDKDNPQKPFWNRATKWVSAPGSTFKLITMAAALRADPQALDRMHECTGSLPVGDTAITDAGLAVHGRIDLKKALAVSCNVVFAQVALDLGDEALRREASAFGIGDYFLFSDLVVENSVYPSSNRTEKELAWTGPGQSSLQLTPMHMTMIAGAIANKGVMMEPKLLLNARSASGESRYDFMGREYRRALSETQAAELAQAMRAAVTSGTATRAHIKGMTVCGKTGSAQIDGQKETNAWFVGFVQEPSLPYVVCVVVEDAGGGGSVAAPIAGALFKFLRDTSAASQHQ